MTIGRVTARRQRPTLRRMDARSLGYLGLGTLVAIVVATLVGVPPQIWIPALLIVVVLGLVLIHQAQAAGTDLAERVVARKTRAPASVQTSSATANVASSPSSANAKPVDVELVRTGDGNGTPDVWLHRCGGRRVHRYATEDGWAVQQVSTKDPDNPRKRIIGDTFVFARMTDAEVAADDLARGESPHPAPSVRLDQAAGAAA